MPGLGTVRDWRVCHKDGRCFWVCSRNIVKPRVSFCLFYAFFLSMSPNFFLSFLGGKFGSMSEVLYLPLRPLSVPGRLVSTRDSDLHQLQYNSKNSSPRGLNNVLIRFLIIKSVSLPNISRLAILERVPGLLLGVVSRSH